MTIAALIFAFAPAAGNDDAHPVHTVGDFDLSSELELGWRFVGVAGSRAEFEEDFGAAAGAFVRSARIDLERARGVGALRRFALDVAGVGEPSTGVGLELGLAELQAEARYSRTEFAGTTDSDLHSIETTRERTSLELLPRRDHDHAASLELELWSARRDSFSNLSRSVDFGFVAPVPTSREDRELGVAARSHLEVGGWRLELAARAKRGESRDHRDFAQPSPSAPTVTQTEDFDGAIDADSLGGGVGVSRRLGAFEVDGRVDYDELDGSGDQHEVDSGVLFAVFNPFRRLTTGNLALTGRHFGAAVGVRWRADDRLALFLRGTDEREASNGTLDSHEILNEGGSVSVTDIRDVGRFSQRTEMIEGGFEREVGDSATVSITARTGRAFVDHFETSEGTTIRDLEGDFARWGGEAELDLEPADRVTLSFDVGSGIEPMHNTFEGTSFAYGEDRASWGSLRARWSRPNGSSWTASLARREGTSEAFGSESLSDSLSLAVTGSPSRAVTASLSAAWRRVDLTADTVILLGFQQFRAKANYSSDQYTLQGTLAWSASSRFAPSLSAATTLATSDSGFAYSTLALVLPYALTPRVSLGLELDLRSVEADAGIDLADYRSAACAVVLHADL